MAVGGSVEFSALAAPPSAWPSGSPSDQACDASGHHPIGPGLAGGVDSPPQASATACEKWCCETSHMQTIKPKQGDAAWKFTEEAGGTTPRQCDFWAWKEAPANDAWTKGCWVLWVSLAPHSARIQLTHSAHAFSSIILPPRAMQIKSQIRLVSQGNWLVSNC